MQICYAANITVNLAVTATLAVSLPVHLCHATLLIGHATQPIRAILISERASLTIRATQTVNRKTLIVRRMILAIWHTSLTVRGTLIVGRATLAIRYATLTVQCMPQPLWQATPIIQPILITECVTLTIRATQTIHYTTRIVRRTTLAIQNATLTMRTTLFIGRATLTAQHATLAIWHATLNIHAPLTTQDAALTVQCAIPAIRRATLNVQRAKLLVHHVTLPVCQLTMTVRCMTVTLPMQRGSPTLRAVLIICVRLLTFRRMTLTIQHTTLTVCVTSMIRRTAQPIQHTTLTIYMSLAVMLTMTVTVIICAQTSDFVGIARTCERWRLFFAMLPVVLDCVREHHISPALSHKEDGRYTLMALSMMGTILILQSGTGSIPVLLSKTDMWN